MNEQKNVAIPKIKLDESKKHIVNKEEMIEYINYYVNKEQLDYLKNELSIQKKVSMDEVKDLIEAIDERIKIFNNYNIIKNDYNGLNTFYRSNLTYLGNSFMACEKHDLDKEVEDLLYSFFKYTITNEDNHIQNDIYSQELFNKLKNIYDNTKESSIPSFYNRIQDIMKLKDSIINRIDESANDYSDLTKTTVLRLSNSNNPGHSLTEEDEIDKTKIGGFIVTSIILQSSIILALILSLISLFNK